MYVLGAMQLGYKGAWAEAEARKATEMHVEKMSQNLEVRVLGQSVKETRERNRMVDSNTDKS